MPQRLLLAVLRVSGLLVTGSLVTVGSLGLGLAVMTDCTTAYSCGPTNCGPCLTARVLTTGGWMVQGVLFAVAVALCLPRCAGRLRGPTLAAAVLVVPVVAILVFAGVSWAAERSYCRDSQDPRDRENYCHVRAAPAPQRQPVVVVPAPSVSYPHSHSQPS